MKIYIVLTIKIIIMLVVEEEIVVVVVVVVVVVKTYLFRVESIYTHFKKPL